MARGIKGSAPPCSVEQCGLPSRSLGLCEKHRAKLRQTGTLERIRGTPADVEKRKLSSDKHRSDVSKIDPVRDTRTNQRGSFASKTVSQIKYSAIKHGYEWRLSNVETYWLMIADCTYCGVPSGWPKSRNGIDRINCSIGYLTDNCVTCCFACNSAKHVGTVDDLMRLALRIVIRHGLMLKHTHEGVWLMMRGPNGQFPIYIGQGE